MKHQTRHTIRRITGSAAQVPIAGGVRRRLAALLAEREQMLEEIRQLTATVQIYAEIVRRLQTVNAPRRAA